MNVSNLFLLSKIFFNYDSRQRIYQIVLNIYSRIYMNRPKIYVFDSITLSVKNPIVCHFLFYWCNIMSEKTFEDFFLLFFYFIYFFLNKQICRVLSELYVCTFNLYSSKLFVQLTLVEIYHSVVYARFNLDCQVNLNVTFQFDRLMFAFIIQCNAMHITSDSEIAKFVFTSVF